MMRINELLSQLHNILKCKMALLIEGKLHFYPGDDVICFDGQILQGYNSMCIESSKNTVIFFIDANAQINSSALELAGLCIKNWINESNTSKDSFTRLLKGEHSFSDVAELASLFEGKEEIYFVVISGVDRFDNKNELLEIINNSIDIRLLKEHQESLVALIAEQDIKEACSELQRNILTELYAEPTIVIGGSLERPQQLAELYNNCIEAILLKQRYGINQRLLDYQGMMIYRLIASLEQSLKSSITDRVFDSSFKEALNSELELTIEEMFKNNLNLTDTAARLYIHRNTLLYRIDKIYKLTGFDLRKFEDSMIFKLAWLMYKEN